MHKRPNRYRWILFPLLLLTLSWFAKEAALEPLVMNRDVNTAVFLANQGDLDKESRCQAALSLLENLPQDNYAYSYAQAEYVNVINTCIRPDVAGEGLRLDLAERAVKLLEDRKAVRPFYTRTWLTQAGYANVLLREEKDPDARAALTQQAEDALAKARELSPGRQKISVELMQTYLYSGQEEKAESEAERCLALDPHQGRDCYWILGLASAYLGKAEAPDHIATAKDLGQTVKDQDSINTLVAAYSAGVDLPQESGTRRAYLLELVELYQELLGIKETFQRHASLAFAYRELGEYEKAREEAQAVLRLSPESKENVEAFLRTLP